MLRRIPHIILVLATAALTACVSELDSPRSTQQGSFAIHLAADSLAVDIETRAARLLSGTEAEAFFLTLTQDNETLWQHKAYATITDADRTQPLGQGYILTAENITADEAETLNDGWGARRYAGSSEPFGITAGQTTYVTVPCRMTNAGLCVTFDDSFTSYFTDYAVTTDDRRTLKFNGTNAAAFDANRQLTAGTIAYYNPSADDGSHTVDLFITASAGWEGTVRLHRSLTLQAGKIIRLRVKLNGTEPTEGNITLTVTYDDTFDEQPGEEVLLE